jgi:hypothetical protein
MKVCFAIALLLAACEGPKDAVKNLNYYQDSKTGMCFASGTVHLLLSEDRESVFTWVPCEKVPPQLLEKL